MTRKPFTIFYDPDREPFYTANGKYYIFAPSGCVMVNNRPAAFLNWDQTTQNVELDIAPGTTPYAVYAHVYEYHNPNTDFDYEVEFNNQPSSIAYTRSAATVPVGVVCVAVLGQGYNDGNHYDICTSAINLFTPSSPRPFEVSWDHRDNNGSGAWIIYWPYIALNVNGHRLDPSGMSQSQRGYGWYVLPASLDLQLDDFICLAVTTVAGSTGADSVSIVKLNSVPSSQPDIDGNITYYIAIARIKKIRSGSQSEGKEVDQYLCSSLYLGNGRLSKPVSLLGKIRYKTSQGDHKWQVQTVQIDRNGNVTENDWEDVDGGVATPISGLINSTAGS